MPGLPRGLCRAGTPPLWDSGHLPVRWSGACALEEWATAPERSALLVEGWDHKVEEFRGHWMGVTHDGTIRCLSRGIRPLVTPPHEYAAAGAVRASIPGVYTLSYAVLPALGVPPQPPQR